MYCSNCGKKIDDDAVFCPFCGAKQEAAPSGVAYQKAPESQNNTWNPDPIPDSISDEMYSPPKPEAGQAPYYRQVGNQSYNSRSGNTYQSYNAPGAQGYDSADQQSLGLNILSFFFPVAGLAMWLLWRNTQPVRSAGIFKWTCWGAAMWFLSAAF